MKSVQKQAGAALVIVLVVLAVLIITSLALMQATDTANTVAGNIAFKQASNDATDIGINQALTELANRKNPEADIPGEYYATQQPADANGLPTTVNWSQVPITKSQGNSIQHITERLCTGPLPIKNPTSQCLVNITPMQGSNKFGTPGYRTKPVFYYRATIFVTGPKNTQVYIQTILNK